MAIPHKKPASGALNEHRKVVNWVINACRAVVERVKSEYEGVAGFAFGGQTATGPYGRVFDVAQGVDFLTAGHPYE